MADIPRDNEDEWGDELDDHEHLHATGYAAKLDRIYTALRHEKWGIRDLLIACCRDTDSFGEPIVLQRRNHKTGRDRRRWVAQALNTPYLEGLIRDSTAATVPAFCRELKALRNSDEPYFGQFDYTNEDALKEIDFLRAFALIKEKAPRWYNAQSQILKNERAGWASYPLPRDAKKAQDKVDMRIFMITSMACSTQASQRSNFFSTILDIYLMSCGVKRRVIETLSGLGICHSYSTANRILSRVSIAARVCVNSSFLLHIAWGM
jgi:hypothetical protein